MAVPMCSWHVLTSRTLENMSIVYRGHLKNNSRPYLTSFDRQQKKNVDSLLTTTLADSPSDH